MTEQEWLDYMMPVVLELKRVIKLTGSAVLIVQPNSHIVGSMRTWIWKFYSLVADAWNIVQDTYWWNTCALPTCGANSHGLLRPSVKHCVWLGLPDCYRDQSKVLWDESKANRVARTINRSGVHKRPSGLSVDEHASRAAAGLRGGVTPFNLIPVGNGGAHFGHPAATPAGLCDWWVRYACPKASTVLDPFCGSGSVGVAAIEQGCDFIGFDKMQAYLEIAQTRLAAAQADLKPRPSGTAMRKAG
jgi:hypothetical protein